MTYEEFVASYLRSEELRKEIPDPVLRRQMAESTWAARNSTPGQDPLTVCCQKQNIPEVETVMGRMLARIRPLWRRRMQSAVEQAVQRLRELEDFRPTSAVDGLSREDSGRDLELLAAAFFELLYEAASQPLTPVIEAEIGRAVENLLRAGAQSQSLPIDLSQEPLLRAAARQDLRRLLAARIELRRDEIKEAARNFLTSRRLRLPLGVGESGPGFQTWLDGVLELTGLGDLRQWSRLAVDQWGYRWYVLGQFTSGIQSGMRVLRAAAVRDGRTTPFCIWVNGKVISIARAKTQVRKHLQAALRSQTEDLLDNWPMLPNSLISKGSPAEFRSAFVRVGLPPYHFGCRTTVNWSLT